MPNSSLVARAPAAFARACAELADLSIPFDPPPVGTFGDAELLEAQRVTGEIRRRADAAAAVVAAEIAHRSRRELGDAGLAQRLGARTPALLVARITGTSAGEAQAFVRVGAVMTPDAADQSVATPWLAAIGLAVRAGKLSLAAADAIRAGLGSPDDAVTPALLEGAASRLLALSASLAVEQLSARAREARSELDAAHVRDREQAMRDRRFLRITPQSDGMTRVSGLLDPESASVVVAAYDAATSPRRGGPRFVDPLSIAHAERLLADERTLDQLGADAFVELIRLGTAAAPDRLLGARKPAVRVVITDRELAARRGSGRIEGQTEPISIETVERHICESGVVPVLFDEAGQALDVGREQRLFTNRQRVALAVRDGGCRFPDCERPPSWCEAHHIDEWSRDHGRTDVADGFLLCRHHHLLVHNNDWRVSRERADYFLVPPPAFDPAQRPIPAPTKSATMRHLVATA
jgi:hypothetical protein